jgi:hypothetical protein
MLFLVVASLTVGALSLGATSPQASGEATRAVSARLVSDAGPAPTVSDPTATSGQTAPDPTATTGADAPGATTTTGSTAPDPPTDSEPPAAPPATLVPEPGPARAAEAAPVHRDPSTVPEAEPPTALEPPVVEKAAPVFPAVRWRRSRTLGSHTSGRLVGGVLLPAAGEGFVTWDPIRRRSPNRAWRRWGSDRLIRTLLAVQRKYHAARPDAPPLVIGDLSRPSGGEFGSRFGGLGHVSHQNGLDVDIYYPRRDGALRPPRTTAQIDPDLARLLVRLWLRAGARFVFVGPGTKLTGLGPRSRLQAIRYHDDHMHVRLGRRGG